MTAVDSRADQPETLFWRSLRFLSKGMTVCLSQSLALSARDCPSVYRPRCHELLRILLRLRRPKAMSREAMSSFSFLPPRTIDSKHANAVTALTENCIAESAMSAQPTRRLNSAFCLSIHSLHSPNPCCSARSLVSNKAPSIL
jgi:hypothetical protein